MIDLDIDRIAPPAYTPGICARITQRLRLSRLVVADEDTPAPTIVHLLTTAEETEAALVRRARYTAHLMQLRTGRGIGIAQEVAQAREGRAG